MNLPPCPCNAPSLILGGVFMPSMILEAFSCLCAYAPITGIIVSIPGFPILYSSSSNLHKGAGC